MTADLPVFRARVRASELRRVVDTVSPIVTEARLDFAADGVRCAAVDDSHVAMVVVRLAPRLFEEWSVSRPGSVVVDMVKLGETLKIPRGESAYKKTPEREAVFDLALGRDDHSADPPNRLHVGLTTPGGARIVRSMAIVDASCVTEPRVPTLEPTLTATGVDPELLSRAVKDAGKVSDHVDLRRTRTGVAIRAWGETTGESTVEIPAEAVAGSGRARFPLDFMGKVAAAVKRADGLTLAWSTDYPVTVGFRWGDAAAPAIEGRYLVAARVEDDGDDDAEAVARNVEGWYSWAMRTRPPAEPDYSAAAVELVPDDVIEAELRRVAEENALAMGKYETEAAEYPAKASAAGAAILAYDLALDSFVRDWKSTHPRAPSRRTIRQYVGERPLAPSEPLRPRLEEPFERGYRARSPDREDRKRLRGHPGTGASWGPTRPAPAEPAAPVEIRSFSVPEPVGLGALTPGELQALAAPEPGLGSVEAAAAEAVAVALAEAHGLPEGVSEAQYLDAMADAASAPIVEPDAPAPGRDDPEEPEDDPPLPDLPDPGQPWPEPPLPPPEPAETPPDLTGELAAAIAESAPPPPDTSLAAPMLPAPTEGPPGVDPGGAAARTLEAESYAFDFDASAFIPAGRVRVRIALEPDRPRQGETRGLWRFRSGTVPVQYAPGDAEPTAPPRPRSDYTRGLRAFRSRPGALA